MMKKNEKRKNITISEIAKLANTSKTTVSFYLNNKFDSMSKDTRKRIEKAIKMTNYVPSMVARSLSNSKTNLIGIIISDITNIFSNQLVKGIEECANKYGYQIIIGSSNYDYNREKRYVEKFLQLGIDGFIIQPTSNFTPLIDIIKSKGKELIFIDSNLDNNDIMSVKSDNYNSVYKCMATIVQKNNYDNYIMIGGDPMELSTRHERANGFMDCLKDNNLPYKSIIVSNNAKEDEVSVKLLENIQLNKNNFIFVPNCWLLPVVNQVLDSHRNLMPKIIGLLGFDNIEWCRFVSPKITTIVQPAFKEGYVVAEKLIKTLNNEEIGVQKLTLMCDVNWEDSINLE